MKCDFRFFIKKNRVFYKICCVFAKILFVFILLIRIQCFEMFVDKGAVKSVSKVVLVKKWMFDNDFKPVPWDIFEKIVRFDVIWGKKEAIWSVLDNAECYWGYVWVHFLELGWCFGREWKVFFDKNFFVGRKCKIWSGFENVPIFSKMQKNIEKFTKNRPKFTNFRKKCKKSLIFNDFWGQKYRIFKNRKNMVKNCLKNLKKLHFLQFLHIFKC